MKKLKALTKALQDAGVFKDSDHSAVDQGAYIPTGKNLGHGVEIARLKYDALIQMENVRDCDATSLLAFIPAWIMDHDPDRDRQGLADPDIDVSLNGDGTADVELTVEFDEGLEIVPDDSGPIPYEGQQWSVSTVPVYVAEKLEKVARKGEDDA